MKQKKDIYNIERKFHKQYNNLFKKGGLSDRNRALLKEFFNLSHAEGLTLSRQYRYLILLNKLLTWLPKDIEDLDKNDLIALAGKIKEQDYTDETKKTYLNFVKKLFKAVTILDAYKHLDPLYIWLYDRRNKFYSQKIMNNDKEQIFSEEEVLKIINTAPTLRDRAAFAIFATQGLRPSELLTLRPKDIYPLDEGLKLVVDGKTGVRSLFVYEKLAINPLQDYLSTLPKDQVYIFDISEKRLNDVLKEVCRKLGIHKRSYLYLFRKFSATRDMILGMSPGALMSKYGWTKKSGMRTIAHYDKSVSADYQAEVKARHGLGAKKVLNKLENKLCPRCGHHNKPDDIYCTKCATNLNLALDDISRIKDKEETISNLNLRIRKLETVFEDLYNRFIKKR